MTERIVPEPLQNVITKFSEVECAGRLKTKVTTSCLRCSEGIATQGSRTHAYSQDKFG